MPGGDGTGPAGMGPMTGWGAGYCAGFDEPGSVNFSPGRRFWGFWGGRGGGRGWRNRFYATGLTRWQRAGWRQPMWRNPWLQGFGPWTRQAPTVEEELGGLKEQAEYLEDALAGIRQRIEEVEAKNKKE